MLRRMSPNYQKSAAHLEAAVEAYPEYAEAWAALGEARLGLENLPGAKDALTASIDADPKYLRPYEPLMQMAYLHGEWGVLNALSERYLKLAPSSVYAQYLAATSAAQTGNLDRAESLVLKMRDHGEADRWPLTRVVMAMVHEGRAQFEQAATEYESFLEVASDPARGQGHEAAVRVAGPAGHKAQERGARRIPLEPGVSGTKGYRVPPSKYGSRASFAPSLNGERNRRHDCRASSCLDSSDDDQTIPRTPPPSRARCSPCRANAATSRRSRAIIMRASLAHAACSFFWSGSSGQRGIRSRSGPCG